MTLRTNDLSEWQVNALITLCFSLITDEQRLKIKVELPGVYNTLHGDEVMKVEQRKVER